MRYRLVTFTIVATLTGALNTARAQDDCGDMLQYTGTPEYIGEIPPHQILCRKGYVLSYNLERKVADWVIESLSPSRFTPNVKREDGGSYKIDRDIPAEFRSKDIHYKGSRYDTGHHAPADDMTWNLEAMKQSFLYSNMAPQTSALNRGVWRSLEGAAQDWTILRKRIIVISGPIYQADSVNRIGPGTCSQDQGIISEANCVYVPDAFFKIIYYPRWHRVIAFRLENNHVKGRDFNDFRVSVDEIEEDTGLDFLTALDPRKEKMIERLVSYSWRQN